MEFLTSTILSGIAYDAIKKGINITINYVKSKLKSWIIDDDAIECITNSLNNIPSTCQRSAGLIKEHLDIDEELQKRLKSINSSLNISNIINIHQNNGITIGENNGEIIFSPNQSKKDEESQTVIDINEVQVGILALNSGDIDRSIMHFENAIKSNPNNIGAYLGMIRATFGEQSIPYCKRLELFPKKDIIKYLISHPDMMEDGNNALLSRIIYNTKSFDMIKTVLEAGVNPNSKYALYYAIKELKDPNIVQLLMEFKTNANWEYKWEAEWDYENRSALIVSVWEINNLEIAKILVENGADVNYISTNRRKESWTVLDIAVRMNNIPMVEFLLQANANPNHEHIYYWGKTTITSILSDAIKYTKNPLMVKLLLEFGANPNYTYSYIGVNQGREHGEYQGSGLSDTIIYTGNNVILKLLLDAGADPKTVFKHNCHSWSVLHEDDGDNCTVPILDLAILKKNKEAIILLIEAGASFDDICYVEGQSFPLKRRYYENIYDKEIISIMHKYGWKQPNIFQNRHIHYSI